MNAAPRRLAAWRLTLAGMSAVCLIAAGFAAGAQAPAEGKAASAAAQEFVLLTEARPVLIRAAVELDRKPVQAVWDAFVQHLFTNLDLDGDEVLSQDEVERAPALDQILTGGLGRAFGGMGGKAAAAPSLAELDTDKDGRVTLTELAAYYRKSGFLPVQVQPDGAVANPLAGAALYGGMRPEPTVEAVAEAIFALLDTNKDGKLTRDELAAAPVVLLAKDENDDEMIVPSEFAPSPKNAANIFAGAMMMGGGGATVAKGNKHLLLVPRQGEAPPELVRRLQETYGAPADNPEEKQLSRKDLGLDEATFARLDTNRDGVLDAAELASFVKRPSDLALNLRVGRTDGGGAPVEAAKGDPLALSAKLHLQNGVARLDLGRTRVDLRTGGSDYGTDRIGGILRQQLLAQFKQADKDKNGYLDEKEAAANATFRGVFKAMDRDGDGKVYESEAVAYFDQLADLQQRARAACVTLVLTNQSRGLFDLLDVDRDGRLSMREMRGAAALLDQLDTEQKGFLEQSALPRSYQLMLRRGPAAAGNVGGAAILELYRGADRGDGLPERTAGPLWFRKMDRNRDGDVSRKEFLGTDAQFRAIDIDGDGLISPQEAEQFDAASRRK